MAKSQGVAPDFDYDAFAKFREILAEISMSIDYLMHELDVQDPDDDAAFLGDWREVVTAAAPTDRDYQKMIKKLQSANEILDELGCATITTLGIDEQIYEKLKESPEFRAMLDEHPGVSKRVGQDD